MKSCSNYCVIIFEQEICTTYCKSFFYSKDFWGLPSELMTTFRLFLFPSVATIDCSPSLPRLTTEVFLPQRKSLDCSLLMWTQIGPCPPWRPPSTAAALPGWAARGRRRWVMPKVLQLACECEGTSRRAPPSHPWPEELAAPPKYCGWVQDECWQDEN